QQVESLKKALAELGRPMVVEKTA
ncbi:MAG: hypothetical protein JWQ11_3795, partial [Rhizobacter sp.]|nr:hypothetical protein [Rhizobacter sp.]